MAARDGDGVARCRDTDEKKREEKEQEKGVRHFSGFTRRAGEKKRLRGLGVLTDKRGVGKRPRCETP